MNETAVRDASTIILLRDVTTTPRVLMGQRGKGAIFLPDKFVFPGGAVDASDSDISASHAVADPCAARLAKFSENIDADTLALAAIRELWEETGQILGTPGEFKDAPPNWSDFAATGHRPNPSALRFFFRAVTPPGRPRRFDARFFLADASALATDPDAMPEASDELSHLRWVNLQEARALDLAFITQLVLAELAQHLPSLSAPRAVPFIKNDKLDTHVVWL